MRDVKLVSWLLLAAMVCALSALILVLPGEGPLPAVSSRQTPVHPAYNVTIERDWLTMPDGVRLSVTYFMPIGNETGERFPVLLEMLPYRKDDMFYLRDYPIGMYFAEHGIVVARVDVRGTGSSEGTVPVSEYSEPELSDGVEIIGQLAMKPWSNGNVGMYGISWSGFNSLMIAARKPPALKAIIAVHSSQDLYYNDCHYIDGVFHMDPYEVQIDTDNGAPQSTDYLITPQYLEERFYREPWIFAWKRQQTDGALWQKESLREKPGLEVPAYMIGGLLDGYRDTPTWMTESSHAPVKVEIGTWNHAWPNNGIPGPNYEWREKAVRWWGIWLNGEATGILDEPQFMVFVRDATPPSLTMEVTPGAWNCGDWPVPGTTPTRVYPGPGHDLLAAAPGENGPHTLTYQAGAGMAAGEWWGELTGDMSADDAKSLVYDSEPLTDPVEIIGMPEVHLNVSADAPLYQWTVRLEDVWPNGSVSLVSGVLINPAHRGSRLEPKYLVPGEPVNLTAKIHFTTWTFRPGHRIRLAVSNAQFPMAWPTPYRGNTTLYPGPDTWITLPVVPPGVLDQPCVLPAPEPEEQRPDAEYLASTAEDSPGSYDPVTGEAAYTLGTDDTWRVQDKTFRTVERYTWRVNDNDPANASFHAEKSDEFILPGRVLVMEGLCHLSSNETTFNLTFTRRLTENGDVVAEKTWNEIIPRKFQ
jgi:hypothetical protein